jgi:hypothetical protein
MGCLKGGTVAGVVVPTPDYVRVANHYSFRPDFWQRANPESKGLVENLVGYVKSDLMVPAELTVKDLAAANAAGLAWAAEVNNQLHSEICAVPAERLLVEAPLLGELSSLRARTGKLVIRKVDRLSCVRFGSARSSVPTRHIGKQVEVRVADGTVDVILLGAVVASHRLVAPGEASVDDDHYGGPGRHRSARCGPRRRPRRRSVRWGRCRIPSSRPLPHRGSPRWPATSTSSPGWRPPTARRRCPPPWKRAVAFGRFRAHDVRSIISAGAGVARPTAPGDALIVALPSVPTRS